MSATNTSSVRTIVNKSADEHYEVLRKLGAGAFGTVYLTRLSLQGDENAQHFAVKETFQDMRYKNREAEILSRLSHPGVVSVRGMFYTQKGQQTFLNIAMPHFPGTLHDLVSATEARGQKLSFSDIRWYSLQLFRTIGYLETLALCHRDIKPQNILVDPSRRVIKMCDFGSAKQLVSSEANKHYICSRFYRAPELLCKSTRYSCSVDRWSVGCCLAEMFLGRPLFDGGNTRHQLSLIKAVLGDVPQNYPSRSQTKYASVANKGVASVARWKRTLRIESNEQRLQFPVGGDVALEFLRSVLQYNPVARPTLKQTLAHPYYRSIVSSKVTNDKRYPALEWTHHEKSILRSLTH